MESFGVVVLMYTLKTLKPLLPQQPVLSNISEPREFFSDVETRKSHIGLNLVNKAGAGGLSSFSSPRTRVFHLRCVLAHCHVKG